MPTINGTDGDDVINETGNSDTIFGLAGNDRITSSFGHDTVDGGEGSDTLVFISNNAFATQMSLSGDGSYNGFISNAGGHIVSFSSIERFEITTGSGNDILQTGNGNDIIQSGGGDDQVNVGAGFDIADGGDGFDRLTANLSSQLAGLSLDLRSTSLTGPGFSFTNFERWNITATQFDDTITVGARDYIVGGGEGHDTLIVFHTSSLATQTTSFSGDGSYGGYYSGFGGDIVSFSSIERFEITTGSGNDILQTGNGNDIIQSGGGDDQVNVGAGFDSANGGDGQDRLTADLSSQASGLSLDLRSTTLSGPGFLFLNFERWNITATAFDDMITVGRFDQTVGGGEGHDTLIVIHTSSSATQISLSGNGSYSGSISNPVGDIVNFTSIERFELTTGSASENLQTGNGNDVIRSGAGNDIVDGGAGADMMYGGTGEDAYIVDNVGDAVFELAGEGTSDRVFASANFALAATSEVEFLQTPDEFDTPSINLTGSDTANIITGNNGNNVLRGRGGNDELYGFGGDDLLVGGAGDDRINGGGGSDTASYEDAAAGVTVSLGIIGNQNTIGAGIDRLEGILHLTGSALDDTLTGNAGPNVLKGGAGHDILIGGTGADRLEGGTGDDRMYVDSAGDVIIETTGAGTDIVYASVGYTLTAGAWVELLTTTSIASTFAVDMTGNELSNTIWGNNGNNTLSGGIGGQDTLVGFLGNDTYLINNITEVVVENAGEGTDIVYVNSSYTLSANASIELLSTYDIAGTQAFNLTGNNLDNTIWGNRGNNQLSGGIGGNDTLVGFLGDDVYLINNTNETIVEHAGEGTDIVYVNSSYTLSAGASIELLSTYSIAGTQAFNMTGNELSNTIWGNRGNNTLSGGIGGNDTLVGFLGNDIYLINNGNEFISELANEGTDIAYAAVNYVLSAGASIELLSTSSIGGTNAQNLTGNELVNTLWGNNGANVLNGGAGNDTLSGFGGADTFAFTTALGASNVDAVTDFSVVDDTIALDDAIFAGIGTPGAFNANAFRAGAAAADADDRIVYNQATGQLFYDADGNGAGAAVLFATLQGNPVLTASDFQVI